MCLCASWIPNFSGFFLSNGGDKARSHIWLEDSLAKHITKASKSAIRCCWKVHYLATTTLIWSTTSGSPGLKNMRLKDLKVQIIPGLNRRRYDQMHHQTIRPDASFSCLSSTQNNPTRVCMPKNRPTSHTYAHKCTHAYSRITYRYTSFCVGNSLKERHLMLVIRSRRGT